MQTRAVRGTLDLLVIGVLDVGDPLADLRERLPVPQPLCVKARIDGEADRLQRGEQRLGGRAGELGCVGERAECEHRLIATPLLAIHHERLLLLSDRGVRAPLKVMAERLKRRAATGSRHDDRVGLPVMVKLGLAYPATRGAA